MRRLPTYMYLTDPTDTTKRLITYKVTFIFIINNEILQITLFHLFKVQIHSNVQPTGKALALGRCFLRRP